MTVLQKGTVIICDSGVVGNARPCQGRDRGFEPRLSLVLKKSKNYVFTRFLDFSLFYVHHKNRNG